MPCQKKSYAPKLWLINGSISVQNLSCRYAPDLELCLSDINVNINAGEKIGIVGTPNSGKSAFMLSLLRLIEQEDGYFNI